MPPCGSVTKLVYYKPGEIRARPYLTENLTYLGSSAYTSRYIFNRMTSSPTSVTANGVTSQVTSSTTTNWAAPSEHTVGSLSQTMSYSSFLGLTSSTGPNGASVSIGYDAMARPTSVTSPFGATTTTAYNDTASPPTIVTSVNSRRTQQTLDGFGRTILTTTGYGSVSPADTVSQAETVYGLAAARRWER